MFENVNLENALYEVRKSQKREESAIALEQFKDLFVADWEREKRILNVIQKGCTSAELLDSDRLKENNIFTLSHIKTLAIKYRLRFLSTKHFNQDLPREALQKIKSLEAETGSQISALMMLAPSSMYKLEDANSDPLLFAPLADGRFYLIHQWGGDLAWYRAILAWPFAKLPNLALSIAIVSLMIAMLVPMTWLSPDTNAYFNFYRLATFGWNMVFLGGIVSYFWFALNQQFSVNVWNSKYFN